MTTAVKKSAPVKPPVAKRRPWPPPVASSPGARDAYRLSRACSKLRGDVLEFIREHVGAGCRCQFCVEIEDIEAGFFDYWQALAAVAVALYHGEGSMDCDRPMCIAEHRAISKRVRVHVAAKKAGQQAQTTEQQIDEAPAGAQLQVAVV